MVAVNFSSRTSRWLAKKRTLIYLVSASSYLLAHDLANQFPEFEVIDFILAREGTATAKDGSDQPAFIPSPASGITATAYSALSNEDKGEMIVHGNIISSITWLLEPERGNVHYRKYSGTLEHPRHTDKQGSTINALQHFAYLNSNKSLILADIQGRFFDHTQL